MAMMAKMRNLAPAFIILIGGLFVLFMVISDSRVLEIFGQTGNVVGSVNGRDITYQEFSDFVERARENQRAQTGQDIDEEFMDQFREQVWDALVTQILIEQQYDKYDVTVADQEIQNLILGPNPPEFLKQNFIDSTGRFNRDLYESALFDPRNKEALINAEEAVRQQLRQTKLESFLQANLMVGEQEIRRRFIEQNISVNADYTLVDVNTIPDSLINVTDEDLRDYYGENRDDYKIEAQRKLNYVLFSLSASAEDSFAVKNNLEEIIKDLEDDTASFKTYVEIYSDQPYSKDTLSITAVSQEAVSPLLNANKGSIIGPYGSFQGYTVYNLIDKLPTVDEVVKASHILISSAKYGDSAAVVAQQVYEDLKAGADFAQTAKEKSDDPRSARNGGDLGWFGKGQMVKPFEDAAFKGKIGEIQSPIETTYGYHIVKVQAKAKEKFVVERIINQVKASGITIDRAYNNATDFAYVADKNGFQNEAGVMNYNIMQTQLFSEDAQTIPGLGQNKGLINFAFENDMNDVSQPFKVPAGYVVAQIAEVVKPGFQQFDEVKEQIRPKVLREKKFERAMDYAAKIKEQNVFNNPEEVYPQAIHSKTGSFKAAQSIPALGRDHAFIETALDAPMNEIVGPFKGRRGAFLLQVTERTPFDSTAYAVQRNSIRDNLLQTKRSAFFNDWLTSLKETADIVDERYKFYR